MRIGLFDRFRDVISSVKDVHDPRLTIDVDGPVRVQYSVFDHINRSARLVIMGITPGELQANEALRTARAALSMGLNASEAMKRAKTAGSFAGAMRSNLVAVLDHVGVAEGLGIPGCASLWLQHADPVHFMSALRYPTFVNGRNYSGSHPKMTVHKFLRDHLLKYTGGELSDLSHALLVPLGPAAVSAAAAFADAGSFPGKNVLLGLPHPSGANAGRISYFLGRKERGALSVKTNAAKLDRDRETASQSVQQYFH